MPLPWRGISEPPAESTATFHQDRNAWDLRLHVRCPLHFPCSSALAHTPARQWVTPGQCTHFVCQVEFPVCSVIWLISTQFLPVSGDCLCPDLYRRVELALRPEQVRREHCGPKKWHKPVNLQVGSTELQLSAGCGDTNQQSQHWRKK